MMKIYDLSCGDEVHRYMKSIVIKFAGARKVLSTAHINGCYQENLTAVYNYDANAGAGMECKLTASGYIKQMHEITQLLGLEPEKTAMISTAASMDNVSIKTAAFEDVTVTAIVTGGVEVNGGRAGDPATFHERKGEIVMVTPGTINIMLVIDADLQPETMARALVTCSEAKTVALQELMAGSNYSHGIATGSGTDGTIIISNSESSCKLLFAGKHAKLGELIGITVRDAVKEALYLQSGLCSDSQHSMLRRMKRYGVDENRIWKWYCCEGVACMDKADFINGLHHIEKDTELVVRTSMFAHLLDQYEWGLFTIDEINPCCLRIFAGIRSLFSIEPNKDTGPEQMEDLSMERLLDDFSLLMSEIVDGAKQDV